MKKSQMQVVNSFYFLVLLIFLSLSLSLSGCSSFKKMAIGSTASVLSDASPELETEMSWETVRASLQPSLKVVEGLLFVKPDDKNLLLGALKGYVGQAFAVDETNWLEEKLDAKAEGESPATDLSLMQAVYNYSKAVDYGYRLLTEYGMNMEKLKENVRIQGGVSKFLNSHLGEKLQELEAVMYTAQALGSLINLRRDDLKLVVMAPLVKDMFDWVCQKKPDINFGSCELFLASYDVSRPKALGGDPEAGKERFLKLFEQVPHNWMARAQYLETYVIPMGLKDEFEAQVEFFEEARERFDYFKVWNPKATRNEDEIKELGPKRLRLYQSLALKRIELLSKYENILF